MAGAVRLAQLASAVVLVASTVSTAAAAAGGAASAAGAVTQAPAAMGSAAVAAGTYDVVWRSPSLNASGSMPLGGADGAALNLWAEAGGSLLLMLSHTDTVDEAGRLLKVSLLNISFTPNPWGATFTQRLHLANGSVTVRGANGFVATVFVEAERPVVRVEAVTSAAAPVAVTARLYPWRATVSNETARQEAQMALEAQFADAGPQCHFMSATPDVLQADNTPRRHTMQVYHRNAGGNATQFASSLSAQGLDNPRPLVEDPLAGLTWGAVIGGVSDGATRWELTATAQSATGVGTTQAPILASHAATSHSLAVVTLVGNDASAQSWMSRATAQLEQALAPGASAAAMRSTAAWWADTVWQRSFIDITSEAEPQIPTNTTTNITGSALVVSQRNALQRFMEVASARGRDPIRFDGLVFTFAPHPDKRLSSRNGGAFWWQNTRFPYYALQATDAPELMQPIFDMYAGRTSLTLAKAKARAWFGHSGAVYHETTHRWGIIDNGDYGCDRTFAGTAPTRQLSEVENGCIHRHYTAGLEVCAMALEQHALYPNSTFLQKTAIPLCTESLSFYATHYTGTRDTGSNSCGGSLVLFPGQALERWQSVINPATDVAGLQRCVLSMLALSPTELNETDREAMVHLKARLPPLWVGTGDVPSSHFLNSNLANLTDRASAQTLWPAQAIAFGESGGESPQLYSVFPYSLFPNSLDNSSNRSVAVNNHSVPSSVAEATIAFTLNSVGGSGRGGGATQTSTQCNVGWCQDVLFQVGLGLAHGAQGYGMAPWQQVLGRFREGSQPRPQSGRFPTFWDHRFDGAPEEDHGAVARIALSRMLVQWERDRDRGGQKIYLLSAWPLDVWPSVSFKLPAPNRTVIVGTLTGGKMLTLVVTPTWRRADIVTPSSVSVRFEG